MKRKIIAALLAALMAMSLTGCVEQTGDQEGEWRPDPDSDRHGLLDWVQEGSGDPDRYWGEFYDGE